MVRRQRGRIAVLTALMLLLVLGAAGFLRGRSLLRTALDGRRVRMQQEERMTDDTLRAQMFRQQADTRTRGWLSVVSVENIALQGERGRLNAQLYAPLRAQENTPWALVLHGGLGTDHTDVLDVVCELSLAGWRVLAPDLYAHGGSEGEISSLGLRDAQEVCAWIEWILAEEMGARIVIWGQDEGAVAALMAAGEGLNDAVKAIAADSAYISVQQRAHQLLSEIGAEAAVDRFVLNAAYRVVHGVSVKQGELKTQIGRADIPLLMMHGTGDTDTPAWHSEDLTEAAGESAELFFAEGAAHGMARFAQPEAYYEALLAFYENALDG